MTNVGGQFRAAYLIPQGNWYVRPQFDVNVTYVKRDGDTESGAVAANLSISSSSKTYVSFSPSVEFGGDVEIGKGLAVVLKENSLLLK